MAINSCPARFPGCGLVKETFGDKTANITCVPLEKKKGSAKQVNVSLCQENGSHLWCD